MAFDVSRGPTSSGGAAGNVHDGVFKQRLGFLFFLCIVLAGVLGSRAAVIQILRNPRLETMARRQFREKVLVRPRRGPILDRNGEPLAVNLETNSLAADPGKISNRRHVARLLSRATGLPYSKLIEKLDSNREFVWIKRHLSEGELERFKRTKIMDSEGELVGGLWLVKESQRVYPHGELAANVLGDVNVDSDGLDGVELWKNEELRGKIVSMTSIKDALGRPAFIDATAAKDLKDGDPLSLTIDASLQFAVEEALAAAVHRTGSQAGSVIAMNAQTGEILAMANQPTFNPNETGVAADRKRNRVITDGYEPGSTLKPVLLATALSDGMKLTDQVWGGRGQFYVQGKRISEAEAREKFEWLSLKKIVQVSSNVGAAKLALELGADRYLSGLRAFSYGSKTGVGFPGEIPGKIPPRKDWEPLTTANIGFGQGILVTPIQMIRSYAAFLNGGFLVSPTLIQSRIEPPRRVISAKVADEVVEALESVTEEGGTGTSARLDGYRVAGKTGTAQTVDPKTGKYSRSNYIASFIGFAVDVDPKIVIYTRLDEPRRGYYASETAAPLFREVLAAVANRFNIPADPGILASSRKNEGRRQAKAPATPASPAFSDRVKTSLAKAQIMADPGVEGGWQPTDESDPGAKVENSIWKMPSLRGLSPREAIRALQGHRLNLQMQGVGLVRTQVPAEGQRVSEGATVRLVLGEP